ncbi:MAG: FAD-dependent oxidoreductase, partial [Pirellulales bacterium]|nr:FAD-dependent oxidoreductase [Pirellulales bacterium]
EPHVAEEIFEDFVSTHSISVYRDEWLDRSSVGLRMQQGKILSIKMLSGKVFHGKIFIDASYEGDLMAAAGVTYTVGREGNDQYKETLNGVQTHNARSHQFKNNISAYTVPGDPSSGLLPRIQNAGPGTEGSGDHRVQAYNYRMCLTRVKENRVPFPKPNGYDPQQYELLLRDLLAGSRHINGKFDMLPNLKTDTNNHGSFSTDNIGMNYDYPDATYARRQEILDEHKTYQQGFCYFLANDPRVPEDVRSWYGQWGLAKDEFIDTGHWPHQIYVREARRMVGDLVVNERHLRRIISTNRSIGMGSYNMDSHNVQRYVDEQGYVRNEGDIQVNPGGPYPIDYGAIIPQRAECQNLFVVCAVSTSHIAYGSVRMEPVFMILGQSAATAAALAIQHDIAIQDVEYASLAKRLMADGQVLEYTTQKKPSKNSLSATDIIGTVVDDQSAQFHGSWVRSTSIGPYIEYGYRHDANSMKGQNSIRFSTTLKPGPYEVRLAYTNNPNRASNVPVVLYHANGKEIRHINQKATPPIDNLFVSLGTYDFEESGVVEITNTATDGYVVADAVVFIPAEMKP